jgi:hypothetical protein
MRNTFADNREHEFVRLLPKDSVSITRVLLLCHLPVVSVGEWWMRGGLGARGGETHIRCWRRVGAVGCWRDNCRVLQKQNRK